jgi:hypothetical protein
MSRKVKDPMENFEKMLKKENKKMAKFSDEYMEMMEEDELTFKENLRELTETGDIYGNLWKIK